VRAPTAPGGFASTEGRSFQLPAARGHRPRPSPPSVGGSRTERPATGSCGLRLPSPLAGATPNRPGGFATEGRSFQLPAAPGPTPSAASIVRGWKPHKTPGNWTLRASFAKPPGGGCDQPPPAVSQLKAAVFTCRPCWAQRPWPRPPSVGGSRTERPATGSCGLRLPSPLRGLRLTAPGGFASTEGRSFQLPAVLGPNALRPSPPSVGGSRTKRPATGSCGLHLPSPLTGAAPNRPRRFRNRRPQFSTAGRIEANALWLRPPDRGGKSVRNARQLEVAGFVCQAP